MPPPTPPHQLASCHRHPPPGAGAGHWLTCPNQSCSGPALLTSPRSSLRYAAEVCNTRLTWIPTSGRKSQGSRFQAGMANEKAPMSDLPFKIDGISFHIPLLMMLLSPTLCGLRGQVPWELRGTWSLFYVQEGPGDCVQHVNNILTQRKVEDC